MKVKNVYSVWATERHIQQYETTASSEEEAKDLFNMGASDFVDGTFEFVEMESFDWDTLEVTGTVLERDDGTYIKRLSRIKERELAELDIQDGDLDDLVHDHLLYRATEINNAGTLNQIAFLINDGCSLGEFLDYIKQLESDA